MFYITVRYLDKQKENGNYPLRVFDDVESFNITKEGILSLNNTDDRTTCYIRLEEGMYFVAEEYDNETEEEIDG